MAADQRVRGRRALGAADDDVVVFMAARFEAWKGQHGAHRSGRSGCSRADVKIWIAGGVQRPEERSFSEQLESQIDGPACEASVSLLGERTTFRRCFALADIYCQPNLAPEPFGIAIAEAMRAGLPCVVSNAGGAAELVDGTCGVLTTPGDAVSVAAAMALLADSRDDGLLSDAPRPFARRDSPTPQDA